MATALHIVAIFLILVVTWAHAEKLSLNSRVQVKNSLHHGSYGGSGNMDGGVVGGSSGRGGQQADGQQQEGRNKGIPHMLAEARDEVTDIVEGFVFAKDNAERVDHLLDVVDRHKRTIGLVSVGWLVKNRLLSNAVAHKAGKATIASMRQAEAAKWGTRRGL